MPMNPTRKAQGGDVEGTKKIDVSQGEAIQVAKASYDPGYSLENTLDDAGVKFPAADLVRGFCDYGASTGEPGSNPLQQKRKAEEDPADL